jgi:oligoribonuclease
MNDREKPEQKTVLVWLDLETTGLDENNGQILEYAVMFTDLELNHVYPSLTSIIEQDVEVAQTFMDEYCVRMHYANGLLGELEDGEQTNYQERIQGHELALITVLKTMLQKDENIIFVIAGSTISFDKRWIKKHMPELHKMLHYRQLDVSVYKVGFPDIFGVGTSVKHRAMADIRDSIELHRQMRSIVEDAWKYEQLGK